MYSVPLFLPHFIFAIERRPTHQSIFLSLDLSIPISIIIQANCLLNKESKNVQYSETKVIIMYDPQVRALLGWEAIIDHHLFYTLRAAQDRDFTYFKVTSALHAQRPVDEKVELRNLLDSDTISEELDNINITKCDASDEAITTYTNALEAAKDQDLDALSWEALLDEQEAQAIETVTQRIKQATEGAKGVIRALPAPAQLTAANVYVEGANIAMTVFNTLCDQIAVVAGKIADFVKKVFTAITKAYDTVKNTVVAGINAIKGLFGFANSVPLVPETSSAKESMYKGYLNWHTDTPMHVASTDFGAICKAVIDNGLTIHDEKLVKSPDGVIESCVSFGFSGQNPIGESLKNFWRETVRNKSKTGYIPSAEGSALEPISHGHGLNGDGGVNGHNGSIGKPGMKHHGKKHRSRCEDLDSYLQLLRKLIGKEITVSHGSKIPTLHTLRKQH